MECKNKPPLLLRNYIFFSFFQASMSLVELSYLSLEMQKNHNLLRLWFYMVDANRGLANPQSVAAC